VKPSTAVRDLGSDVSMRSQVSWTVSHCFGTVRQLRTIRHSVSQSIFQSLVAGLVQTKIDFGNPTLASIPSFLQAAMNAAARLVFQTSRYDHITPLLCRLHWLRVPQRISFKLPSWYTSASVDLDRPTWLTPFSRSPGSRSTTLAVIVDVSTGLSVYTTVHCRRPSVSRRRGTNMEQFAS